MAASALETIILNIGRPVPPSPAQTNLAGCEEQSWALRQHRNIVDAAAVTAKRLQPGDEGECRVRRAAEVWE